MTTSGRLHEINVTPFIDVMLVLLIIFMVAAPLSTVDLPVDHASGTAVPMKKPDNPEVHEQRVFLRADRGVPYGELMDVLELLRTGGYSKIALVALEGVPEAPPSPADRLRP